MSSAPPPPPYANEKANVYPQEPPPVQMAQPMYIQVPMIIVGDYPLQCTCPRCGKPVITRVEKKVGILAWIICGVLFFTALWICCFIPFCVDGCKDTEHYCPNCSALLGVNKRL